MAVCLPWTSSSYQSMEELQRVLLSVGAVLIPSKVCCDRANATHLALSSPNTAAIHLCSSFAQQGLEKNHAEITPEIITILAVCHVLSATCCPGV